MFYLYMEESLLVFLATSVLLRHPPGAPTFRVLSRVHTLVMWQLGWRGGWEKARLRELCKPASGQSQGQTESLLPARMVGFSVLGTQASLVAVLWWFPHNNWSYVDSNEPILSGFTFFFLYIIIIFFQPNQIVVCCYLYTVICSLPFPPFDIAFCHLKGYGDQF